MNSEQYSGEIPSLQKIMQTGSSILMCEYIVRTLSNGHEVSNEYVCLVENQWMHKSLLYFNNFHENTILWRDMIEIFMQQYIVLYEEKLKNVNPQMFQFYEQISFALGCSDIKKQTFQQVFDCGDYDFWTFKLYTDEYDRIQKQQINKELHFFISQLFDIKFRIIIDKNNLCVKTDRGSVYMKLNQQFFSFELYILKFDSQKYLVMGNMGDNSIIKSKEQRGAINICVKNKVKIDEPLQTFKNILRQLL